MYDIENSYKKALSFHSPFWNKKVRKKERNPSNCIVKCLCSIYLYSKVSFFSSTVHALKNEGSPTLPVFHTPSPCPWKVRKQGTKKLQEIYQLLGLRSPLVINDPSSIVDWLWIRSWIKSTDVEWRWIVKL